MRRTNSFTLLAVLALGVFLAGLELMVTAVALPQILASIANWTDLRKASWIINGYLLVYVITMPLAGRLTDLWGARRLFLAALTVFTLGSLLAGLAQDLDQLIAARLVQAVGGGAIIPVATAAASHLFDGPARPRALGIIGALTFLGMAAGPFVGAAVLETIHPETALANMGISGGPLVSIVAPAWRWVFLVNVPIRHMRPRARLGRQRGLGYAKAPRPSRLLRGAAVQLRALRHPGRNDVDRGRRPGIRLADEQRRRGDDRRRDRGPSAGRLVRVPPGQSVPGSAPVPGSRLQLRGLDLATHRVRDGDGDRRRRGVRGSGSVRRPRTSSASCSGRSPGRWRSARSLSGFLTRRFSLRGLTLVGLAISAGGLAWMSTWTPSAPTDLYAVSAAVFGFGFGLTVTPRSTAAVESAGRAAFGAASATVTVARMIGMAVGMAALTAYGSTTITRVSNEIYGSSGAYKQYIPEYLRSRSLTDGLVAQALEQWAASKAASIMVGIFLVAAVVTLIAAVPAVMLRVRHGAAEGASESASTEEIPRGEIAF